MRTALVLQGGAALGAYEAGVLKALLEPPARRLDIVTGVSIGAIMAALVVGARNDPWPAIEALWQRMEMPTNPFLPGMFANTLPTPGPGNLYRINPMYYAAPPLATYMYESAPLLQALEEWVDFVRLRRAHTELIVTAVDVRTGRLEEFSNRTGLTARHIVASASLPPVFPPTQIEGRAYWDGGLIANTPLRPALNAIEVLNETEPGARWEVIVVDLFAPSAKPPQDMTDVLQRAFELSFFGKFQHDLKLFEMYNAQIELMRAVDAALPPRSPLRRHPAFVRMSHHRRVDQLTVIRASKPEAMGGPADFSPDAIERRIAQGYEDAHRTLSGASALPPARRRRPR
ncbi:MAG TPA: patatin-like phospholipase family protein [Burkholderiaceae bacterium]|nr:patatin-like phospholipase family protein [Burkholderiaceae bacterium]